MPKIQKIAIKHKGNKEYECFLEDGQCFILHEDILVNLRLYKGQELSEEQIQGLETESGLRKVYHKALSYLSYRMRSKAEMEAYLIKKDYPSFVVKRVINKLEEDKLLNDSDFATAFVRTKVNTTMSGPGKIKQDLIKKGIAEQDAYQALEGYTAEEQLEQAKKLIKKRMSQKRRLSHKELKQRVKQYLLQKGFSFDMIVEAFADFDFERDPHEEWGALLKQAEKAERKYRHLDAFHYKVKMKTYLYSKGFSISDIEQYLSHHNEE